MNGMAGTWAQFVACALVIGYAGGKLARYGDIIGQKAGWSGSWAGLILLSTVTSLPELATGISAAGFNGKADIAAGDVFGSCSFNLLILCILDAFYRKQPLYVEARQGHALEGAFGMALLALAGAALTLGQRLDPLAFWNIGVFSPAVAVLYLLAMRAIHKQEQRAGEDQPQESRQEDMSMRRALLLYGAAALAVVAAGGYLPFVAVRLAELMGWGESFVGTLFVAAATSLPELSVSITALRLGQPDMAVANILGSNMFNIIMLAIDDIAYREGPLLSNVAPLHAVTVFATLIMGAMAVAALVGRPRKRVLGLMSWHSFFIVAVFALSSFAQYRFGMQ